MPSTIDNLITFRILRLLTTPFEKSDAFRLGIIDKNGNELKPISQLRTAEEQDAYSYLHRLVFRLKKIINKVPIDNKTFLSFAAAWALIKEDVEYDDDILEELFYMAHEDEDAKRLAEELEGKTLSFKQFVEEMGVGGGAVAGIGIPNPSIPNQAEPGVSKAAQKKWQTKNGIARRKKVI